jgi:hypothetical protein
MPLNVNSTASLLGAFGVLDRTRPFLLEAFFPMEQTFDTEEIYFDRVQRARRLAPIVSPHVEGKAQRSRGYATYSFTPPYLKPKHAVSPTRAFKRRAGEQLLGLDMTPEQRYELAILDNMQLEDDMITRREEYWASQLLQAGLMTVSSPDFEPVTIDLQRNSAHTVTLSGGSAWGQSGVDPFSNLAAWATTVGKNSGFHPRLVVMGATAAGYFQQSSTIKTMMQSFRQREGLVDLVTRVTGEVSYIGSTPQFDFVQYTQYYTDDSGTAQPLLPATGVIMGDPVACGGVRAYGAIRDRQAAFKSLTRFPKVWDEEDPSVTYTMMQSAPLPLLGWADATFYATVA